MNVCVSSTRCKQRVAWPLGILRMGIVCARSWLIEQMRVQNLKEGKQVSVTTISLFILSRSPPERGEGHAFSVDNDHLIPIIAHGCARREIPYLLVQDLTVSFDRLDVPNLLCLHHKRYVSSASSSDCIWIDRLMVSMLKRRLDNLLNLAAEVRHGLGHRLV